MIYCLHMTAVGNHVVDQASQAHNGEGHGPGLPIALLTDSADALVVALQRLPADLIAAVADTVRVIDRMGFTVVAGTR